ncbi:SIMPL domain-containing protein [Sphingomonas sp. So64.6b]|uniref:SIMPL domain-containing protein n=1 Tax=Sphingomonas sp. So64.6b TaxID=2997354 RepID=UPI001601F8C8|nr:SIMPL domain-containing protein [Sphingomonas sp. So64.6b]QNA83610.1 SIMPL domain-containing protein [Sphingomonas sp. So64.6b]
MTIKSAFIIATMLSAPALAQTRPAASIIVSAVGKVETPPDVATLRLSLHGEGKTPDAAVSALAEKQKAVFSGLRSLDPKMDVRTGSIAIREVRSGDCGNGMFFDTTDPEMIADQLEAAADQLEAEANAVASQGNTAPTKGPCKVIGRIAQIEATVLLASVKDAGTAVGLAGRLGANQATVETFALRDEASASRRAVADAMRRAQAQAEAIASASGANLGPIISVEDSAGRDSMTMSDIGSSDGYAAQALAPPIIVDITPTPVVTNARLTVTFALDK